MILNKTYTISSVVESKDTAKNIKSGDAHVLATPVMVALMEQSAFTLCSTQLDEGYTTVGTALAISHLAATPVGMKITATATLVKEDVKMLYFTITAFDEVGAIGEGTHTRAIVQRERFQEKADAKRNILKKIIETVENNHFN